MKKIFTSLFILFSFFSFSQSTTLVISQAYGSGGNSGALYTADYVELHNVSGTSQSLAGLSVQYASSSATGAWTGVYALPAATIPAGGYYLIQMSAPGAVGSPIPTPDAIATPAIAMSGTSGRVAIVNGTTAVTACPAGLIDLVGYGTSICFEGAAATPVLSSILAAVRNNQGCADTDNNGADFTAATPAPRNSASAAFSCTGPIPTLTITGTIANFGNVVIGSSSASQSYFVSGTNLTGAPGVITITAPSADFEVSNNNTSWGASATVPYTSATMTQTEVWIRFSPQSVGLKTGNVSNAGGGAATVNVPVSGTGILPPTPLINASGLAGFGNVCVNATAGPNSFIINASNLTNADITVGPLAGFSFSTTATGTYTNSLTLTQPGGTYTQQVFVQFTPTAIQSYDGNIAVGGGGAPSIDVAAVGSGSNNPPVVTSGTAVVTPITATVAGLINNNGCTAVTAYGVAYSLTSGFTTGTMVNSSNLSAGSFTASLSGLTPATTYYYKAFATNSGGTGYGAERSFTTETPVLNATALTAFGDICLNNISAANSFTISSTGLNSSNITVGPRAGYAFSTAQNGTYSNSLSLTQPGGPYTQVVYVKFAPTVLQSYNTTIPVGGGGAVTINVPVSGNGVNLPPAMVTADSMILSPYAATLKAAVANTGCSDITFYGIEYSSIRGFTNGQGLKVNATNLSNQQYSVTLNSLVPSSTYYYKAYAFNNGGIAYGEEKSFTTGTLPDGLVLYSVPVSRGSAMHYSLRTVKPAHYAVKLFNSNGQLVFRRDIILQLDFIDDWFTIPGTLSPGVYMFVVENTDGFRAKKPFMIR